jgi:hypothetical protein
LRFVFYISTVTIDLARDRGGSDLQTHTTNKAMQNGRPTDTNHQQTALANQCRQHSRHEAA